MPILTDLERLLRTAEGRAVQLEGLPLFNDPDDEAGLFRVTTFDGWFDTAAVDSQLAPNGGAAGAVAVGDWLPAEATYQLGGIIDTGRDSLADMRRLLLAAVPADREATIAVLGQGYDVDLCIFVRRYDRPTIKLGSLLEFTVPLVAPDPYKYATAPLRGVVGVFTGEKWFRRYTVETQPGRTYQRDGGAGPWFRTYTQDLAVDGYPPSVQLLHRGDATSRRVVVEVAGPLQRGDWHLVNEATGARCWAALDMTGDQLLTLDTTRYAATLNGTDVGHLIYGDWPTLVPGVNTYRLVAGSPSGAYATITAREAYQ